MNKKEKQRLTMKYLEHKADSDEFLEQMKRDRKMMNWFTLVIAIFAILFWAFVTFIITRT